MSIQYHNLKNKVALVTGAARGIGRVIAQELAKAELRVIVTDIQEETGKSVVEDILSSGHEAFFIKGDLRSEKAIKDIIDTGVQHFGRLDIVINNARPDLRILPFEGSLSEWDLAMDVLLKAPALLTKYAVTELRKVGGGSIINIGSTNAFFVSHQPMVYHVAKAGLIQLTRYLACEFGSEGVRVNCVCPGLVDIYDNNKPLTSNPINKAIVEFSVPLKRAAVAEEIAEAVLFLCSNSSAYITGQVLTLDGGITLNDHFHLARKGFINKRNE